MTLDADARLFLSRAAQALLGQCHVDAWQQTPDALLCASRAKLDHIRASAPSCPFANLALAEAIAASIESMFLQWSRVSEDARPWCKAAVLYFIRADDEEDDVASPVGFEDDAEVLNACLKLAGLPDLCVNPEEFDDAD